MMSGAPIKLRSSQEQALFEQLFEFSPDAIVVTDSDGRITNANVQVERFFGYTRAELLGQPIEVLVPERFRRTHPARRKEYTDQASVSPMGVGLQHYGRRKDGSECPVDIMIGPVEAAEGRIVLSVIRDLTEKRVAEEALLRSE